jgi:hypothetical protein
MSTRMLVVPTNRTKNFADEVLDSVKQAGTSDVDQILVITLREGRACWDYGNMSKAEIVYLLERVKHAILNK